MPRTPPWRSVRPLRRAPYKPGGGGQGRVIDGGEVQKRFWGGVLWYVSPLLSFPPSCAALGSSASHYHPGRHYYKKCSFLIIFVIITKLIPQEDFLCNVAATGTSL